MLQRLIICQHVGDAPLKTEMGKVRLRSPPLPRLALRWSLSCQIAGAILRVEREDCLVVRVASCTVVHAHLVVTYAHGCALWLCAWLCLVMLHDGLAQFGCALCDEQRPARGHTAISARHNLSPGIACF